MSRHASTAALVLAVLLAAPGPARAQTNVLLQDGGFASWTTAPGAAGHQVSGQVDGAAGAPPPSYRIQHSHVEGGTFGASVVSRSTYQESLLDLSGSTSDDRLDLRVDGCVGVLQGEPGAVPLTLSIQPVLVQGETVFRPTVTDELSESLSCASTAPSLSALVLDVPLRNFRGPAGQSLDLSAGAPRVRFSLTAQTTWVVFGSVIVRLDNLVLRRVRAGGQGVGLELSDLDQGWADEIGSGISYRIEVVNLGRSRDDLVVEALIPANTCFTPSGSTAGWRCGPDMATACSVDGDGLCSYPLARLDTGNSQELDLRVELQPGIPAEWEFLAEARLRTESGAELATEVEITPPVALTGPGCLCLFLGQLCE